MLIGDAFLPWQLEFRQSSFSLIGRVLRNPLDNIYLALFRFSQDAMFTIPLSGMANLDDPSIDCWRIETSFQGDTECPLRGAHKRAISGNLSLRGENGEYAALIEGFCHKCDERIYSHA